MIGIGDVLKYCKVLAEKNNLGVFFRVDDEGEILGLTVDKYEYVNSLKRDYQALVDLTAGDEDLFGFLKRKNVDIYINDNPPTKTQEE